MYEPDLVQTCPAHGLGAIRLHIAAGHVSIEACKREDVRILINGVRENPALIPHVTRDGDLLRMDGENENSLALLHYNERLKLVLQIPVGLAVTVRMLAGTLQLNGIFGQLDARLRFGSIEGCAPARRLKIRVFAGDVRLGGLTGAADAQLSLGELTMAWAHLNGGETILARSFVGETRLDLPDHITLRDGQAVHHPASSAAHAKRATATVGVSGNAL
jgi:hypothetical protein